MAGQVPGLRGVSRVRALSRTSPTRVSASLDAANQCDVAGPADATALATIEAELGCGSEGRSGIAGCQTVSGSLSPLLITRHSTHGMSAA